MQLVKPQKEHQHLFEKMMKEWRSAGGRINPGKLRKHEDDYDLWLSMIKESEQPNKPGKVPSSTYFIFDEDILIGAVNIRHFLNDSLIQSGGHIAYGVRPTQRKKGFAKKALKECLRVCKQLNINSVLLTCDKDNIGSAKVIISQGGALENEFVNDEGVIEQRYWIHL